MKTVTSSVGTSEVLTRYLNVMSNGRLGKKYESMSDFETDIVRSLRDDKTEAGRFELDLAERIKRRATRLFGSLPRSLKRRMKRERYCYFGDATLLLVRAQQQQQTIAA